ncbi:MAG: glycosyl transferase family 2, partial [Verrucomicrobia bacterium]|nr:glycosyl transferase family 2 [Verrucomicrobiota bacterium]
QAGQPGNYELKFADGKTRSLKVSSVAAPVEISGPWEVSFAPGWGAPEKITFDALTDWAKHSQDSIRHFSGKATYRKTFELPKLKTKNSKLILNLGEVSDLATVRVNGQELATLWLAPWSVDITAAAKPGANTLEVEVVNTWNNRLAGDAALPKEQRRTFVTAEIVKKSSPLLPAGLLGPVFIRTINPIKL